MIPSAIVCALLTAADAGATPSLNLLAHARLMTGDAGAVNPERLTDGVEPADGELWDTQWTTRIGKSTPTDWDIGRPTRIAVMRLQADNNDIYRIEYSTEGGTWKSAWNPGAVDVPGMQTRTSLPLDIVARYIRISASGGDGLYSVGEFEVFETAADLAKEKVTIIPRAQPPPPAPFNTGHWVVVGVAAVGALYFFRARQAVAAQHRTG